MKSPRLVINEESDFCCLDQEVVANHYGATSITKPEDTSFMNEIANSQKPINTYPFTTKEFTRRLRKCENTASGLDGITYNHINKIYTLIVLTPL